MNEGDWRRLAVAALTDLDDLGLDDRTKALVRADLEAALALPPGTAEYDLRAALTSLQAWLRTHLAAGPRPVTRGGPSPSGHEVAPPSSFGRPRPPGGKPPDLREPDRTSAGPPEIAQPAADPGGDHPVEHPPDEPSDRSAGPSAGQSAGQTRKVHARLDAPDSAEAGTVFDLSVGIAAAASPGVIESSPFVVPTEPFALTVTLMLDGFGMVGGPGPVVRMRGQRARSVPVHHGQAGGDRRSTVPAGPDHPGRVQHQLTNPRRRHHIGRRPAAWNDRAPQTRPCAGRRAGLGHPDRR